MKWTVQLGSEGTYYWQAETPIGDLAVEYPDPFEVMDWEARWYYGRDCEGEVIASGKTAEACKLAAVAAMRKRAQAWTRVFR